MPTWLAAQAGADGIGYGDGTNYVSPCGSMRGGSTEAAHQWLARNSYTVKNLFVRVSTNTRSVAATIQSRKNGANGNLSVSIGVSATGTFEDTANSDSLASADLFCWTSAMGTGTGSATFTVLAAATYEDTANACPLIASYGIGDGATLDFGATAYNSAAGNGFLRTTEPRIQFTARAAFTATNLRCYISANTINGATTFRSRLNAANGSMSVSIGNSATGSFEDTTNSDVVAAADEYNYQFVAGGTSGSLKVSIMHVKTNLAPGLVINEGANGGLTAANYVVVSGFATETTTEANSQMPARVAYTAKNLGCFVSANTRDGASSVALRQGGVTTALSASITASTTGYFEDTSGTVVLAATDSINYILSPGGATGAITILLEACQLDQPPAVVRKLEAVERHYPRGILRGVGRGIE